MTHNRRIPACGHDFPGNEGRDKCFWCGLPTRAEPVIFDRARALELATRMRENLASPDSNTKRAIAMSQVGLAADMLRAAVHDLGNLEMVAGTIATLRDLLMEAEKDVRELRLELALAAKRR